jgi:hypothetical protein
VGGGGARGGGGRGGGGGGGGGGGSTGGGGGGGGGRFAAAMNTEVGLSGLAGGLRGFCVAGAWFSGAGAVYTPPLIVSTDSIQGVRVYYVQK